MNNFNYKNMTPFKWFVLENFPFIENDFDAINNYHLFSKVVEYLNKTIDNMNLTGEQMENLTNAMTELQNYINNLDIQEEVNNKIDEMTPELQRLIQNDVLQLNYQNSSLINNIINNVSQKIAFVGDSLTYCQDSNNANNQLPTWSSMIESFINRWLGLNIVKCNNYGVRGEKSIASINKFNSYIENGETTIVWEYGTNDMTQNVSVNEFLQNLKTFYDLCVHNNIELIVVIPPPNFINLTRRQKMYNLYLAEKSFLEKYGIKYVNMYEYVDNLYKTLYKSHIQLQTDNTHFNDYTCWKDAFLKYITPFVYNQTNKINYVQIDNNRNYSQTNGVITNVSDNLSIFQYGILFKKEDQNTNKIEININLKEDSVIYINGYSNNRSGKFDVTIDNNNLLKNTFNTYNSINGGTYSKDYIINLQIPHILKAGMHNILINNPDYSENSEINRIYIFGLIIKSIDSLNIKKSSESFQTKQQLTLYNGFNSNVETTNFLKDIKNCNEIHILTGDSVIGFTTSIIRPVDIYRNFYENTILNFIAPNTNNEPSIAKMTINIEDNTFTYTSNGIPLRRIYGYINPNTKKYNPFLENDFSAEQNYTI